MRNEFNGCLAKRLVCILQLQRDFFLSHYLIKLWKYYLTLQWLAIVFSNPDHQALEFNKYFL